MTLIQVEITYPPADRVTVTGERVGKHFAITPTLTRLADGTHGLALDEYPRLTHIPTGLRVPDADGEFHDLRRMAERLEALDIDWSATAIEFSDEQRAECRAVVDGTAW